jgi:hypothetical protein
MLLAERIVLVNQTKTNNIFFKQLLLVVGDDFFFHIRFLAVLHMWLAEPKIADQKILKSILNFCVFNWKLDPPASDVSSVVHLNVVAVDGKFVSILKKEKFLIL